MSKELLDSGNLDGGCDLDMESLANTIRGLDVASSKGGGSVIRAKELIERINPIKST